VCRCNAITNYSLKPCTAICSGFCMIFVPRHTRERRATCSAQMKVCVFLSHHLCSKSLKRVKCQKSFSSSFVSNDINLCLVVIRFDCETQFPMNQQLVCFIDLFAALRQPWVTVSALKDQQQPPWVTQTHSGWSQGLDLWAQATPLCSPMSMA
jgi:hypothetical protein